MYSARYAGEDASDEANLDKLLRELEDVPPAQSHRALSLRRSCIVEGADDPRPLVGEGTWEGRIIDARRGSGGFGYDPSSFRAGDTRTAAEMPAAEKHAHSHRGQALRAFLAQFAHGRAHENAAARACTRTFRGACRNARTAISTRTRCAKTLPEQRYIDALLRDLDAQAGAGRRPAAGQHLPGRRNAQPVFAGGHRAAARTRARAGSASSTASEVTLEANPGTIERGRFSEYRAAGVTRVSLGAQSFDARQLKLLGRIHSADETRRAAEELHAAGLANFNLDLMYALPGQSAADARSRRARGARARAGASVAIPPDDRAGHGVRRRAARAAGR